MAQQAIAGFGDTAISVPSPPIRKASAKSG